jgi:hypothetical protein
MWKDLWIMGKSPYCALTTRPQGGCGRQDCEFCTGPARLNARRRRLLRNAQPPRAEAPLSQRRLTPHRCSRFRSMAAFAKERNGGLVVTTDVFMVEHRVVAARFRPGAISVSSSSHLPPNVEEGRSAGCVRQTARNLSLYGRRPRRASTILTRAAS